MRLYFKKDGKFYIRTNNTLRYGGGKFRGSKTKDSINFNYSKVNSYITNILNEETNEHYYRFSSHNKHKKNKCYFYDNPTNKCGCIKPYKPNRKIIFNNRKTNKINLIKESLDSY